MILQEQMDVMDWESVLMPFLVIIFLIFLMGLMIFLYMKLRVFTVILTVFLFSLIFGMLSMSFEFLPFTPFISIFFMLFQTIFFLITTLDMIKY